MSCNFLLNDCRTPHIGKAVKIPLGNHLDRMKAGFWLRIVPPKSLRCNAKPCTTHTVITLPDAMSPYHEKNHTNRKHIAIKLPRMMPSLLLFEAIRPMRPFTPGTIPATSKAFLLILSSCSLCNPMPSLTA